ncbi:aminoimidazole riboside kinase [Vibrio cholerae]|uniref:Aminoimidazole riboside kinase n=2 Tax=Vibrio cholerae TaxID=666 RepID=A0A8B5ZJQ7_VIBCL|nr:fructokinase [Vibrio cholerae TM 11079-80]EGQ8494262.1 aminoimidazole riboside kinase [Vibrio cholerae]EGQ8590281.1 aminoimidazole riboside kinase [Vibrio cholerae]EGQ8660995.1 aminoimidazole riboside kinase [Vibrio cholerae]EGR0258465.1 aminoimidazole riboside kinase [Vibrio cholerae]
MKALVRLSSNHILRSDSMSRVWLTGDAVVDLIPDGQQHYLKCPGGAPANVAVAIARLSGRSAFFGRIGNDPFGRFMQQTFTDEQVDCQHLYFDPVHRTSTVVVDLDEHGERSFTFMVKPSADQFLQLSDIPSFQKGEWLHICSIALANEPSRSSTFAAIAQMKEVGGYVSFDPNLREEVWSEPQELQATAMRAVGLADVVKFSEEELQFLTGTQSIEEGLQAIADFQIPLVVVTLGAKGALVVTPNSRQIVSGKVVKPIDTTGAGDAFVGGLLYRLSVAQDWHNQATILDAVKWANGCGALATTQKGAMTALPNQAALHAFLE